MPASNPPLQPLSSFPQLVWTGKAAHTSVPTIPLRIHERIDPLRILNTVKQATLSQARTIDCYRHENDWHNRLITGDSLLVMNSLLEKEGLTGQVQMIYIDPPYGVGYGSNFQPFANKGNGREVIRAYSDDWELGIHSYLTHLRDRLLLVRELLTESGSCFVQISDKNIHHIRELMDEIFGAGNFCSAITFAKTGGQAGFPLTSHHDHLVWYAKDKTRMKFRPIYTPKGNGDAGTGGYDRLELPDGTRRRLYKEERINPKLIPADHKLFSLGPMYSEGGTSSGGFVIEAEGREFQVPAGRHWKTGRAGVNRLKAANRLWAPGSDIRYVRYAQDFPVKNLSSVWDDTSVGGYHESRIYVVQTTTKVIQRCLLMTTDPGDLVLDPTCGGGTTAFVAEQWGRRWITCDTSRVAITLTKQQLMTPLFDYYELAHPEEGVGSGFRYKTIPHITLKSIAHNPDIKEGMSRKQIDAAISKYAPQETLYDQPHVDRKKTRVTGPFTIEEPAVEVA